MVDECSPLLILSGAYCTAELSAEFGELPPAFLPVGNQRLFEHQVALSHGGRVFLTIPGNFVIPRSDQSKLDQLGVRIIRTPPSLSLVEAIQMALEVVEAHGMIKLLLGDTLIEREYPCKADFVGVRETDSLYRWTYLDGNGEGPIFREGMGAHLADRKIVVGFFSFSSIEVLKKALVRSSSLAHVLDYYNSNIPLDIYEVRDWYDFGHQVLYYQSRRHLMVSRAFNHISSDGQKVNKSSSQIDKLAAERAWYDGVMGDLALHIPRMVGVKADMPPGSYTLEYLNFPTLSDLFVFGNLPRQVRLHVLEKALDVLEIMHARRPEDVEAANMLAQIFHRDLVIRKSRDRIVDFLKHRSTDALPRNLNGQDLPGVLEMVQHLIDNLRPTLNTDICFWHGDFFFGNMFFDFRANRVLAIDPRGMIDKGQPSLFGDRRYDIAKLTHSVVGYYDRIISGRVQCKIKSGDWMIALDRSDEDRVVEKMYWNRLETRFDVKRDEILAMTALLFFSMLPLHADSTERQETLLANACRLYLDWQALVG